MSPHSRCSLRRGDTCGREAGRCYLQARHPMYQSLYRHGLGKRLSCVAPPSMHPIVLIIQNAAPDEAMMIAQGHVERTWQRITGALLTVIHLRSVARSASPVVLLSPQLVLKQWRVRASPRNPDAITGLSLTVVPAPVHASCQRLD
jgi:hypothetical protein